VILDQFRDHPKETHARADAIRAAARSGERTSGQDSNMLTATATATPPHIKPPAPTPTPGIAEP
jgi:hypothetical protein